MIAAGVIAALAVLHPAHGTGLNLCLWHSMTEMPCPGCGMSRSVSCAVRGQFAESIAYHPFGIVLLVLFATAMLVAAMPPAPKRRILRTILRHTAMLNATYVVAVTAFIAFGIARIAGQLF